MAGGNRRLRYIFCSRYGKRCLEGSSRWAQICASSCSEVPLKIFKFIETSQKIICDIQEIIQASYLYYDRIICILVESFKL